MSGKKYNGMQELESRFAKSDRESFERFKDMVPKNKAEWEGSIVLYDAAADEFYSIAFGDGGNLDNNDLDAGFDDYIMVERYELDGTKKLAFVVVDAVDKGYVDDTTEGLREVDGGQLLLKRNEWTDGDIRRFITEALDFAGYGADRVENLYKHLVYIASDN